MTFKIVIRLNLFPYFYLLYNVKWIISSLFWFIEKLDKINSISCNSNNHFILASIIIIFTNFSRLISEVLTVCDSYFWKCIEKKINNLIEWKILWALITWGEEYCLNFFLNSISTFFLIQKSNKNVTMAIVSAIKYII